ncbi:MAG: DUF2726 domain-containing protein [Chloroflexia bacterium]|nr:DUF2726 domain-containing protein [Chloroflexia bacterium]
MRLVLYGVVILLASTGFSLIGWGLWLRWRRATTESPTDARHRDYLALPTLLNSAEQQFAALLCDVLPMGYGYTAQMAVNRLVTVRHLRRDAVWRDPRWNRIAHKSLDFVIIRTADTQPVLAISLADSPDAVLDPIFREVGLPLVYIAPRQIPSRDALQHQIVPLLGRGSV